MSQQCKGEKNWSKRTFSLSWYLFLCFLVVLWTTVNGRWRWWGWIEFCCWRTYNLHILRTYFNPCWQFFLLLLVFVLLCGMTDIEELENVKSLLASAQVTITFPLTWGLHFSPSASSVVAAFTFSLLCYSLPLLLFIHSFSVFPATHLSNLTNYGPPPSFFL